MVWRFFRRNSDSNLDIHSQGSGEAVIDTRKSAKPVQLARLPTRYFPAADKASVSVANTYGLVRFTVEEADLQDFKKGRDFFAVISIGSQTQVTRRARISGEGHVLWGAGSHFVLQKEGASIIRVAIFREGRLEGALKNTLHSYCETDLSSYFFEQKEKPSDGMSELSINDLEDTSKDTASITPSIMERQSSSSSDSTPCPYSKWHDLVDPADPKNIKGRVLIRCQASTVLDLERQLWKRLLALADFTGDCLLSAEEFETLLRALGSEVSKEEIDVLFKVGNTNADGMLDVNELADLVTKHKPGDFDKLIKRCPVDGAELIPGDDVSNILYVSLCLDEGTGESLRGGYTTESQASRAWIMRTSEWMSHPISARKMYKPGGLRTGAMATHIIVYDRSDKRLVEETLSPVLVLAMKQLYQSRIGKIMMGDGLYARLKNLSESHGRYMDSPESVKDIKHFVKVFQGEINLIEVAEPLDSFKTFNEFFYRKLKPGARPIAEPEDTSVIVSAADCRLMVFDTVGDATRCWIKGKNFSIAGLLNDTDPNRPVAKLFDGGSMAIFRLAPQDYHRFHSPIGGTIESIEDISGQYFTVNPIAINSRFTDVFSRNKRSILWLKTEEFKRVPFIAIGATLVGSINWTVQAGDEICKGQELGYFAFGGSTCILLTPPNSVEWDEDLKLNGLKSLESLVKVGERIGARTDSVAVKEGGRERHEVAEFARSVTKDFTPLLDTASFAKQHPTEVEGDELVASQGSLDVSFLS